MTRDEYLSCIEADGGRLARFDAGRLEARVPSCPDWSVAQLVAHTSWVHRWVTYVLGLPEGQKPARDAVPQWSEGDGNVVEWYRLGLDTLLDALRSVPPDKPVFTLAGVQPASWWLRRMAHETAIHRWDVEQAVAGEGASPPEGFPRQLAADGIEEAFEVMFPRRFDHAGFGGRGQTVHLHGTDSDPEVPGEWLVTVTADGTAWQRGHLKGDAAVRGPLSDLYLFVWNRIGPERLDVVGDADLLARWQAAARF
jgi:uncharacterized protein (TIGR03083 family)